MDWYRKAQEEEDDLLGDALRDFILEDASQNATSPSAKGVNVFKSAIEKIFSQFGFKIAGWGASDDKDNDLVIRVFPTKKVVEPNTYHETAAMRNRMEGLDKEKADKLIGFLRRVPGVTEVSVSPAKEGVEWALFNITFDKNTSLVFASGSTWYRKAQQDEDVLLEETVNPFFDVGSIFSPHNGMMGVNYNKLPLFFETYGFKLLGSRPDDKGGIVCSLSFGGDKRNYHDSINFIQQTLSKHPLIGTVWSDTKKGEMHISFRQPLAEFNPWIIEMLTVSGWEDAGWTEEDEKGQTVPQRFPTEKVANEAIDEFIADQNEAFDKGDMDSKYERSDYRAVRVQE